MSHAPTVLALSCGPRITRGTTTSDAGIAEDVGHKDLQTRYKEDEGVGCARASVKPASNLPAHSHHTF